MLEFTPYHCMFDSLGGQPVFDRLCHQLIPREFGNRAGYIPGPAQGKDGGFDSKYIQQETDKPKTQFKFRQIGGQNGEKLRKAVIDEFEKWLADKCSPDNTGTFLFITNVHRTVGDHTRCNGIAEKYPKATIHYWDFDKLAELMDTHSDLADDFLKVWKSAELREQRAELERKEAEYAEKEKEQYRSQPEFATLSLKFKAQFIDWKLLGDQYHGFVYLVEPIYVDDHDKVRAVVRDLFQIDIDTEQKVIDALAGDGRMDITGNVITVNGAEEAAQTATQMMAYMGTDLEKVISLIQGV